MYVLEESIEINAGPAEVWAVLSDLAGWKDWQSFIAHENGLVAAGATITVTLEPPGGRKVRFTPVVIKLEPNHELSWHTRMMGGLFDARHSFVIETKGPGTIRFTQHEEFRGLLSWILRAFGEFKKGAAGFREFNAGLKSKVESAVSS